MPLFKTAFRSGKKLSAGRRHFLRISTRYHVHPKRVELNKCPLLLSGHAKITYYNKMETNIKKNSPETIAHSNRMHDLREVYLKTNEGAFREGAWAEVQKYIAELRNESEARINAASAEGELIKQKSELAAEQNSVPHNEDASVRDFHENAGNRFDPEYVILQWEDVLQIDDEFTPDGGRTWAKTHFAITLVQLFEVGSYRRKIDPGEGYRLLQFGEVVQVGDEFLTATAAPTIEDGDLIDSAKERWKPAVVSIGAPAPEDGFTRYRRKIAIETEHDAFSVECANKYGNTLNNQ